MKVVPPSTDGGESKLMNWTYATKIHDLGGAFDCVQSPNEVYPTQLLNEVLRTTDE